MCGPHHASLWRVTIGNSPNELGGGRDKSGPYEGFTIVVGTRLIASAARAKQCAVPIMHQLWRVTIGNSPNELGGGRDKSGPYEGFTIVVGTRFIASTARAKHVRSPLCIITRDYSRKMMEWNSPNELGGGRHQCGPYDISSCLVFNPKNQVPPLF